jgi:hypothetical protein
MSDLHHRPVSRARRMKMYAVRVINTQGLESADYNTVYGECPKSFEDPSVAQGWADKLSTSGNWPMGNPGYEVVEL